MIRIILTQNIYFLIKKCKVSLNECKDKLKDKFSHLLSNSNKIFDLSPLFFEISSLKVSKKHELSF